jgi:hypothetical protein
MLCVACALALSACGGAETNSNSATTGNANKSTTTTTTTTTGTPATTSSPATTTSSPAATTPASGEKIGVADCDDFLNKYEACISDKVPAQARAQYEASIKQWRDSWRQLAANPQTKASLAQACKMAADQAKQSMTSYGRSF